MAGGKFLTYNKALPGAYINFKSVPAPASIVGSRGIATMPLPLSWGEQGKVIKLLSTDLEDGKSLAKVGVTAFDDEAKLLRECLKHCYKLYVYRIDTGGAKAKKVEGVLTITAKCPGVFGNEIKIVTEKNKDNVNIDVNTYFKTKLVDKQTVANIGELKANAFVEFEGTGAVPIHAGIILEGGTDGTVKTNNYTDYLSAMREYQFNTMGIPSEDTKLPSVVKSYVQNERDNAGKKIQAVVYNYNSANFEGIISVKQGYRTKIEEIKPHEFVATVTGMTAGAEINQSNCFKIIESATEIINFIAEDDLVQEIKSGWFLLTKRMDGEIVVLDDLNTFTDYSSEKDDDFGNNRVIRVFDEIGNTTRLIWEKYFVGKENNDKQGRDVFKLQLLKNFYELQNIRAIQNFSADDVIVTMGQKKDEVKVDVYIQPTDSMKKLYMTVFER